MLGRIVPVPLPLHSLTAFEVCPVCDGGVSVYSSVCTFYSTCGGEVAIAVLDKRLLCAQFHVQVTMLMCPCAFSSSSTLDFEGITPYAPGSNLSGVGD